MSKTNTTITKARLSDSAIIALQCVIRASNGKQAKLGDIAAEADKVEHHRVGKFLATLERKSIIDIDIESGVVLPSEAVTFAEVAEFVGVDIPATRKAKSGAAKVVEYSAKQVAKMASEKRHVPAAATLADVASVVTSEWQSSKAIHVAHNADLKERSKGLVYDSLIELAIQGQINARRNGRSWEFTAA